MRLALAGLMVLLSAAGAAAATWTAEMVEDEGGPVLMARASASNSPDNPSMLQLVCFEQMMVRYDPVLSMEGGVPPGAESDFTFADGGTSVTRHFVFEDMDGMFAAYVPHDDTLVTLLVHGSEVAVADPAGAYPARTFALDGSARAIGRLLADCGD
jgi:hypothetical protein